MWVSDFIMSCKASFLREVYFCRDSIIKSTDFGLHLFPISESSDMFGISSWFPSFILRKKLHICFVDFSPISFYMELIDSNSGRVLRPRRTSAKTLSFILLRSNIALRIGYFLMYSIFFIDSQIATPSPSVMVYDPGMNNTPFLIFNRTGSGIWP